MNKIITIIFLFLMACISCQNETHKEKICGLWQCLLIKDNKNTYNYDDKNSHTLRLLSDNTFIWHSNDDKYIENGTWALSTNGSQLKLIKIIDNVEGVFDNKVHKSKYSIEGDKFYVTEYIEEKFSRKYERNPRSEWEVTHNDEEVLVLTLLNETMDTYKYIKTKE